MSKNRFSKGENYPYVIAELSGNHSCDWERTVKIIDGAINSGVNAIKTQAYDADSLTFKSDRKEFILPSTIWKNRHLYDIYTEGSMPWEWHKRISEICKKNKIDFISTPFDHKSVDFLEKINCTNIKIASSEANDIDFIKYAASKAKKLFVSTGMASKKEIDKVYEIFDENTYKNLVLLKCTASYPCPIEDMNLTTIKDMQNRYKCQIGLSDHSLGTQIPLIAFSMGALVFEKHITLDRNDGGLDSKFSLTPNEFKELVENLKLASQAIGSISYGPTNSEQTAFKYRRSLYAIKDIKNGENFTRLNIKSIRPANGLEPHYIEDILKRVSKRNIKAGHPLKKDDLI